ncbi:MAG TPA: tetratricopeptide repeat protein [Ktedonobacteraceae bacterium]|nr:tetratricopeptide repeat protein [Ktedonobacteraceae bacterium]
MPNEENIFIGNYLIVAQLASGAFGHVYLAQHAILANRVVAIKLMHSMYLNSTEECVRFLQEAQFLEKLKHSHILPVIDVGLYEGIPYLVTEYASKGSLRNLLQQRPSQPLPIDVSITILSQIGEALQYAHQQNIVHRDLKPENILFNDAGIVLIADFGLATTLAASSIKQTSATGTMAYMAPEQFHEMVSKESDQYALGCIAYELFTGHMPFVASTPAALITRCLMEQPIPPRLINPLLPGHIEKAILKAMAKQRTERFPDVLSFVAALLTPTPGSFKKTKEDWMYEFIAIANAFPGDKKKIIAACDDALREEPHLGVAYFCKGVALNDLGQYKEALEAFERAIQLGVNDSFVWAYRGDLLKHFGRREEAKFAYMKAKELDNSGEDNFTNRIKSCEDNIDDTENLSDDDDFPDDIDYWSDDDDLLDNMQELSELNYDLADTFDKKGIALQQTGNYQAALIAFEQAIQINSKHTSAWFNKGNAHMGLNQQLEAFEAYNRAIVIDPSHTEIWLNRSLALFNLGRYEDAIVSLNAAIQINPTPEIYNNKGNALCQLGRYNEASEAYQQALRINPKFALTYHNQGGLYLKLKQYRDALESFKQAVQLNPGYADTYCGMGEVLLILNDPQNGLLAIEKGLICDSRYAKAWAIKGKILSKLRRYREAFEAFDTAIQIDPILTNAYIDKGNTLCQLERYNEALNTFESAIRLASNNPDALNGRGNALMRLKRYDEAFIAYAQAATFDVKEPLFHENIGNALCMMGKIEEAVQAYQWAGHLKTLSAKS